MVVWGITSVRCLAFPSKQGINSEFFKLDTLTVITLRSNSSDKGFHKNSMANRIREYERVLS
jgi:hypothetical protein